jgi:hypothetical protein
LYDSETFTKENINTAHKYAMLPITFKIENAQGFSDYANGLNPQFEKSEDFGNMLLDNVSPYFFGNEDPTGVIERATQTDLNGQLTPKYAYLSDYVSGEKSII